MNEKNAVLFEQYDFVVSGISRGRGSVIAKTDKGNFCLWEYGGNEEKIHFYNTICEHLMQHGFTHVDAIVENKEGTYTVVDAYGKKYICKYYVDGRECNVCSVEDCLSIARQMAKMHKAMRGIIMPQSCVRNIDIQDFKGRDLELSRVRSFIRRKTVKSTFEYMFLRQYLYFQEIAKEAAAYLDEDCLKTLRVMVDDRNMYCHGECNQHNLKLDHETGELGITHLEHCHMDVQVRDLYLFLRKALEKNRWDKELGQKILYQYLGEMELCKEEKRYLFARLLYPERFYKIANGYYNKRKTLPPKRQTDKLLALLEVEKARMEFLDEITYLL